MMKKYLLILKEEGQREELIKGSLEDIVKYLQENYKDLFDWMNSSPWTDDGSTEIELPGLTNIHDLRDLEMELEKVNLDWWTLEIEEIGD